MRKKESLFKIINDGQVRFDPSLGERIYCPICWKQFEFADIESQLSLEHIPPTSSANLIHEKCLKTLTCKQCNNAYGYQYQNDLKEFLKHQLWHSGKFDREIPGKVTIPGSFGVNCNVIWSREGIKIIGVPKANNPSVVDSQIAILNKYVEKSTSDWSFKLDWKFYYNRKNVHAAYIHAAYLAINIRTGYMYSFSNAGKEFRRLFKEGYYSQLDSCIIPMNLSKVNNTIWLAEVEGPNSLRCLWVKVAGNIVILPKPGNVELNKLYNAWQQISHLTDFGLVPKETINFRIKFFTTQDLSEARKCLPTFFNDVIC